VGPYAKSLPHASAAGDLIWGDSGGDWSDIDWIEFGYVNGAAQGQMWIDGLYFSGHIVRVAKNSTNITAEGCLMKTITDDVGKDDSLMAATDTGTIARLAYAELLRSQTRPKVGSFIVPMIKDLLPGQFMHMHAKKTGSGTFNVDADFRVTEFTQRITSDPTAGFSTTVQGTSDVLNSHARPRYNDMNKVLAAVRPEFQDRQASSIKARNIDITIPVLEKDYP